MKYIIPLLMLLLLLPLTSAFLFTGHVVESMPNIDCVDSDGGIDYYKVGIAVADGNTVTDTCDGDSVIEYFCGNGYYDVKEYDCPYGCKDGACQYESFCNTNGENDDKYVRGSIEIGEGIWYDDCEGDTLWEYSCEGNDYVLEKIPCENGCLDGACIKDEYCIEHKDAYHPDIETQDGSKVDYCEGDTLIEYYCVGDAYDSTRTNCENGCIQGKCIDVISTGICTDDGYRVTTDSGVFADYCDGKTFVDYSCNGDYIAKDTTYCNDACTDNGCSVTESFCMDKDGDDEFEKSYVSTDNGYMWDYCGAGQLNEYLCDGDTAFTKTYMCACEDGACKKPKEDQHIYLDKGKYKITLVKYDAAARSRLYIDVFENKDITEEIYFGSWLGSNLEPNDYNLFTLQDDGEIIIRNTATWHDGTYDSESTNSDVFNLQKVSYGYFIEADDGVGFDGGYNDFAIKLEKVGDLPINQPYPVVISDLSWAPGEGINFEMKNVGSSYLDFTKNYFLWEGNGAQVTVDGMNLRRSVIGGDLHPGDSEPWSIGTDSSDPYFTEDQCGTDVTVMITDDNGDVRYKDNIELHCNDNDKKISMWTDGYTYAFDEDLTVYFESNFPTQISLEVKRNDLTTNLFNGKYLDGSLNIIYMAGDGFLSSQGHYEFILYEGDCSVSCEEISTANFNIVEEDIFYPGFFIDTDKEQYEVGDVVDVTLTPASYYDGDYMLSLMGVPEESSNGVYGERFLIQDVGVTYGSPTSIEFDTGDFAALNGYQGELMLLTCPLGCPDGDWTNAMSIDLTCDNCAVPAEGFSLTDTYYDYINDLDFLGYNKTYIEVWERGDLEDARLYVSDYPEADDASDIEDYYFNSFDNEHVGYSAIKDNLYVLDFSDTGEDMTGYFWISGSSGVALFSEKNYDGAFDDEFKNLAEYMLQRYPVGFNMVADYAFRKTNEYIDHIDSLDFLGYKQSVVEEWENSVQKAGVYVSTYTEGDSQDLIRAYTKLVKTEKATVKKVGDFLYRFDLDDDYGYFWPSGNQVILASVDSQHKDISENYFQKVLYDTLEKYPAGDSSTISGLYLYSTETEEMSELAFEGYVNTEVQTYAKGQNTDAAVVMISKYTAGSKKKLIDEYIDAIKKEGATIYNEGDVYRFEDDDSAQGYFWISSANKGIFILFEDVAETTESERTKLFDAVVDEYKPHKVEGCDNGCGFEGKCYQYGLRMLVDDEKMFCDVTGVFTEQKTEQNSCQNNFECSSNICADDQCVEATVWRKIMAFFGFI